MFLILFFLVFNNFCDCGKITFQQFTPTVNYRIPQNHTVVDVKSSFENVNFQSSLNFSSQITLLNKNISLRTLPCIHISNISANAGANFTFINDANNDKMFVLNGAEASTWKNLIFLTPALNIIVPPSTKIAFTVSDKCDKIYTTPGIHKGIIASSNNNGFGVAVNEINFTNPYNAIAKFSVKNLRGANTILLSNDKSHQQMHNGDIIVKNGTTFGIFYATSKASEDEFLIEYEITSVIQNAASATFTLCWIILVCAFGFYF